LCALQFSAFALKLLVKQWRVCP